MLTFGRQGPCEAPFIHGSKAWAHFVSSGRWLQQVSAQRRWNPAPCLERALFDHPPTCCCQWCRANQAREHVRKIPSSLNTGECQKLSDRPAIDVDPVADVVGRADPAPREMRSEPRARGRRVPVRSASRRRCRLDCPVFNPTAGELR